MFRRSGERPNHLILLRLSCAAATEASERLLDRGAISPIAAGGEAPPMYLEIGRHTLMSV